MKSLTRVRKRVKSCYELASIAMIKEADAAGLTLVHGSVVMIDAKDWRYDHAWIETDDGQIYDPANHSYQPAAQYTATHHAVAAHRYTRIETARLMSLTRHHGPWTDAERAAAHNEGR
jgi:hypothetical protein